MAPINFLLEFFLHYLFLVCGMNFSLTYFYFLGLSQLHYNHTHSQNFPMNSSLCFTVTLFYFYLLILHKKILLFYIKTCNNKEKHFFIICGKKFVKWKNARDRLKYFTDKSTYNINSYIHHHRKQCNNLLSHFDFFIYTIFSALFLFIHFGCAGVKRMGKNQYFVYGKKKRAKKIFIFIFWHFCDGIFQHCFLCMAKI